MIIFNTSNDCLYRAMVKIVVSFLSRIICVVVQNVLQGFRCLLNKGNKTQKCPFPPHAVTFVPPLGTPLRRGGGLYFRGFSQHGLDVVIAGYMVHYIGCIT
jgi:hypothetical protein